jgi:hypothetical protein
VLYARTSVLKRRRGWPMMQKWHAGLWRSWDELTKKERRDYEKDYEATMTEKRLATLRGGRLGKKA